MLQWPNSHRGKPARAARQFLPPRLPAQTPQHHNPLYSLQKPPGPRLAPDMPGPANGARPGTIGVFLMSNGSARGTARYSTFFTTISAGEVIVPGLTPGSAGSCAVPNHVLTSLAGVFTIGPDTAALMAPSVSTPCWDLLAAD